MARGVLEAIVGPMYAGKTSEIMKRVLWRKHTGDNVTVLKPRIDDRYSADHIQTHDGHKISVWTVDDVVSPVIMVDDPSVDPSLVVIDEVQFFHATQDVIDVVEDLLVRGVDVIVAGLDQTSKGEPWPTSGAMMALADTVIKLTATCNVCGKPATKTYRLVEGGTVMVGSVGLYEARCPDHWTPR